MECTYFGHQMKRRSNEISDKNLIEKAEDVLGDITKSQDQSKLKSS